MRRCSHSSPAPSLTSFACRQKPTTQRAARPSTDDSTRFRLSETAEWRRKRLKRTLQNSSTPSFSSPGLSRAPSRAREEWPSDFARNAGLSATVRLPSPPIAEPYLRQHTERRACRRSSAFVCHRASCFLLRSETRRRSSRREERRWRERARGVHCCRRMRGPRRKRECRGMLSVRERGGRRSGQARRWRERTDGRGRR